MQRFLALVCTLMLWTAAIHAQDEPEYRLELGAGAGLVAYEGDLNGNILKGMQPMGELVVKYKMNPRMAWTACLGLGTIKGSSANDNTWYPDADETIDFKSSLTDFSVRFEYNFWPFGNGQEYRGTKPITPFIALGMGLSFAKPQGGASATGFQIPIGAGVKYKMGKRWNLAAEWMMHFTGSDKLDGTADPYGIKSNGFFKNTDCYSLLAVTITYDLWAKCKTCHNDKD